MKQLNTLLAVAFLLVGSFAVQAQDKNNPWALEFGINAVDAHPIGPVTSGRFQNVQRGVLFNQFFNLEQGHWNMVPALSRISVSRYIGDNFSAGVAASFNKINRIGQVEIADMPYYAADAEVRYSFRDLVNGPGGWFDPSLGVGGGYTWVDKIGFGSANINASLRFWINDNWGFHAQSSYKHGFEETNAFTHFQHAVGITLAFGGTDTDGDGIYDDQDECPEVPGLPEFNGCPDSDGDGIEDRNDACPDVPGTAEFNGCADSDGDGIADPDDACPNTPGLASLNGCPDADGDGIKDSDDNCPNTPGPAANNGCPWPDTDGDGVLDKDDDCPNQEGTVANNGCPEMEKLNDFAETILFDFGKATIRKESQETINNISEVMKEHPNTAFVIEGHTDSVGPKAGNQRLSEKRAKAVKNSLKEAGVQNDLTAKGYGESMPKASNQTADGRQENRRVEISIKKDN